MSDSYESSDGSISPEPASSPFEFHEGQFIGAVDVEWVESKTAHWPKEMRLEVERLVQKHKLTRFSERDLLPRVVVSDIIAAFHERRLIDREGWLPRHDKLLLHKIRLKIRRVHKGLRIERERESTEAQAKAAESFLARKNELEIQGERFLQGDLGPETEEQAYAMLKQILNGVHNFALRAREKHGRNVFLGIITDTMQTVKELERLETSPSDRPILPPLPQMFQPLASSTYLCPPNHTPLPGQVTPASTNPFHYTKNMKNGHHTGHGSEAYQLSHLRHHENIRPVLQYNLPVI